MDAHRARAQPVDLVARESGNSARIQRGGAGDGPVEFSRQFEFEPGGLRGCGRQCGGPQAQRSSPCHGRVAGKSGTRGIPRGLGAHGTRRCRNRKIAVGAPLEPHFLHRRTVDWQSGDGRREQALDFRNLGIGRKITGTPGSFVPRGTRGKAVGLGQKHERRANLHRSGLRAGSA